ncbi:MAG: hypothetical protein IKK24_03305, partial [Clostridia bacterium]|nr:hypothetical protein [Clostridia bacterium]
KSFIKMFATKEQKAQMTVTVPTEYSNIDINSSGFVYGTVAVYDRENFSENMLIHKLNPIGNDIPERNGYASPMGDVDYRIDEETGEYLTSKLIDIKSFENQFYSVLDERNGRVFTYSEDGFLLFVFGALGQNLGQFKKPSAIEVNGNNFYVTDSEMNYIIEYQLTDYGSNIKNAVLAEGDMEYEKADEYWGKVLQNTAKSSFTYNRIGMSALKNGDYSQAMKYLKLAENRADYSTAYKYVRDTFFDKYFSILAIVLIGVILFIIFIKIIKGRRNKQ